MSVYSRLQDAAVAAVGALALSMEGQPVTVARAKTPMARELLDTLPVCIVCPSERPEESVPFSTAGEQRVTYLVQFALVAGSNRDQTKGHDATLDAREAIRRKFQRPDSVRATVTELLLVDVLSEAPLSRSAFFNGYDYSVLAVRFTCVESAS